MWPARWFPRWCLVTVVALVSMVAVAAPLRTLAAHPAGRDAVVGSASARPGAPAGGPAEAPGVLHAELSGLHHVQVTVATGEVVPIRTPGVVSPAPGRSEVTGHNATQARLAGGSRSSRAPPAGAPIG